MPDQPNSDIQAELAALRERVKILEAARPVPPDGAARRARSVLSRVCLFGGLPLLALLATSGLLHGKDGSDALFIDLLGRIGIGTDKPEADLHVRGKTLIKPASGNAILSLGSEDPNGYGILELRYKQDGTLQDRKHRIGFTDGSGGWLSWSEYPSKNAFIGGAADVKGGLSVGGAVTAPSMTVTGGARVQGDLDVGGKLTAPNMTVGGTATANDLRVQNNLTVNGIVTAASITAPGMVTGSVFHVTDVTSKIQKRCDRSGEGICDRSKRCERGSSLIISFGYCDVYPIGKSYCMSWICISN